MKWQSESQSNRFKSQGRSRESESYFFPVSDSKLEWNKFKHRSSSRESDSNKFGNRSRTRESELSRKYDSDTVRFLAIFKKN